MAEPVEDPESHDEEYDENEDEDFTLEGAADEDEDVSASSADEDAAQKPVKATKKRKAVAAADAEEELDSGDEATIKERKRKRRKGKEDDEDSGGEGGLIKTRAQRLVEKAERKLRKRSERGEVIVDVDALWAELSTLPLGRPTIAIPKSQEAADADADKENKDVPAAAPAPADQLIKIKRRIAFAGEVTEVEEEVLRSSSAAQRYLADHPEADPAFKPSTSSSDNGLTRPLRRPSLFEPNPTAAVRGVPPDKLRPRAPSRLDVLVAERKVEEEQRKKAEKMSTVQKSALDWRGFVKDQGIGEELDEYGKSKRGFLAREQFLDRVAGANEAARRDARLKG